MKETQLHELLAVVADTQNAAQAITDETRNVFLKKPEHFKGQTRDIRFFDEARQGENVTEEKTMVTTVDGKLTHFFAHVGRHFDVLLQVEEANQRAQADLDVDGLVLMEGVPATFLLGMEKRPKTLRDTLLAAPTLEPQIKWEPDAVAGADVWRSPVMVSMRQEKVFSHKILVAATDKHPAQIEKFSNDEAVARIETVHTSGMLTPAEKSGILNRVDKLIEAVKMARQRANTAPVKKLHLADAMFDYIMAG
jgi:hypothetical protein